VFDKIVVVIEVTDVVVVVTGVGVVVVVVVVLFDIMQFSPRNPVYKIGES